MDVFRFTNPTHPMRLEQGELINGLKSKMWIERYRDAGDFEFIANAETMTHLRLPIGSLISHTESTEVMIVENHEIREQEGTETEIKITGRSFESFFDNRIVGSNGVWPTVGSLSEGYILPIGFTFDQVVALIKNHVDMLTVYDPGDAIEYIQVITDIVEPGQSVERMIQRGSLYTRLIELLAIENLGIKTIRPGARSPLGFNNPNMVMLIHKGVDLTQDVIFSYATGEIRSADYLWSNKKLKNAALITGRWFETVVADESSGYDRRMMFVDGADIDNVYSVAPVGAEREAVLSALQVRGIAVLSAQNNVALVKTEPTPNSMVYRYREHYDVGDVISVDGAYNENAAMQISEYVEIEDETGDSGYPTLSAIT